MFVKWCKRCNRTRVQLVRSRGRTLWLCVDCNRAATALRAHFRQKAD